jgi:hypothetical protein
MLHTFQPPDVVFDLLQRGLLYPMYLSVQHKNDGSCGAIPSENYLANIIATMQYKNDLQKVSMLFSHRFRSSENNKNPPEMCV